ncbi:MAG: DUF2934 domain-containing protein [Methylovulum sp.]|nr:DUF2934 domain-containing protein [Methylovulum sp.]
MIKKAKKPSAKKTECQPAATETIEKNRWIAESAYYKALARGFWPNCDQEDWLEATQEYEAWRLRQRKNGLVSLR